MYKKDNNAKTQRSSNTVYDQFLRFAIIAAGKDSFKVETQGANSEKPTVKVTHKSFCIIGQSNGRCRTVHVEGPKEGEPAGPASRVLQGFIKAAKLNSEERQEVLRGPTEGHSMENDGFELIV